MMEIIEIEIAKVETVEGQLPPGLPSPQFAVHLRAKPYELSDELAGISPIVQAIFAGLPEIPVRFELN